MLCQNFHYYKENPTFDLRVTNFWISIKWPLYVLYGKTLDLDPPLSHLQLTVTYMRNNQTPTRRHGKNLLQKTFQHKEKSWFVFFSSATFFSVLVDAMRMCNNCSLPDKLVNPGVWNGIQVNADAEVARMYFRSSLIGWFFGFVYGCLQA